jgi:hypothetical protein
MHFEGRSLWWHFGLFEFGVTGAQSPTPHFGDVPAQFGRLGNLIKPEKCGRQVGRRLHTFFGLAGTLALVPIHRFLEQATGFFEVPKTSLTTAEPLHGEQCRRVVRPQGSGATGQNVFELLYGFSVSTKSLEVESHKAFGAKRAFIVRTLMKSEVRRDIAPERKRFVESTQAFQYLSDFTFGVHCQGRIWTPVAERPAQS